MLLDVWFLRPLLVSDGSSVRTRVRGVDLVSTMRGHDRTRGLSTTELQREICLEPSYVGFQRC